MDKIGTLKEEYSSIYNGQIIVGMPKDVVAHCIILTKVAIDQAVQITKDEIVERLVGLKINTLAGDQRIRCVNGGINAAIQIVKEV